MNLSELENLKIYSDETELRAISEEIGDKISFKGYSQEQVISLVTELLKVDLLSVEYKTREEILNVLCDSALYYRIRDKVNWDGIASIKEHIDADLKEYIEEIIAD